MRNSLFTGNALELSKQIFWKEFIKSLLCGMCTRLPHTQSTAAYFWDITHALWLKQRPQPFTVR